MAVRPRWYKGRSFVRKIWDPEIPAQLAAMTTSLEGIVSLPFWFGTVRQGGLTPWRHFALEESGSRRRAIRCSGRCGKY
jgi:hypothetical protein